jgi:molybdate transport system substrate-binding protein
MRTAVRTLSARVFVIVCALIALHACECSTHDPEDTREARAPAPAERELVVFAAASLREAFDALARELERAEPGVRVRASYAGSQVLRAQLEQGAAADVIAAADPEELAPLVAQQRVATPQVFAHNELVIAKPKGADAPRELRALPELGRIVIGSEAVPVGRYARRMLERADRVFGAAFSARAMKAVVSREPNTRLVLAKVSLGEADAGIVYRSDALAAARSVDVVAIPAELNERAEYVIASVRGAAHPRLCAAFIALAVSKQGQRVLQSHGFLAANELSITAPALRGGALVSGPRAITSERSGATR